MGRPIGGRAAAGPSIPPELATFDPAQWGDPADRESELAKDWGPLLAEDILRSHRWSQARRDWLLGTGFDRSVFRGASATGAPPAHTTTGTRS